jgi:hypothetical protein
MRARLRWIPCLFSIAVLASCGSPGVPLPPSLELAKPVKDLHATRKGNRVILTWTMPTLTSDRHTIRHPGDIQICRSIGSALKGCGTAAGKVPPPTNQSTPQGTFTDELSSALDNANSSATIFYAVSALNSYGRSAGLSNQAQVSAAPALPPPSEFHAELTGDGVKLRWAPVSPASIDGVHFACRIFRREQNSAKDEVAGEVPLGDDSQSDFLDRGFEWEKTYAYRATVVTFAGERSVEGEDTPTVTVIAHDVFPPAAPTGLQAVFSGPGQKPFIDLIWHPNLESDLAGYNVYRHEQGAAPARTNSDLVKAPAFRDENVSSGNQYWYSITAVDLRQNESPHSEEASENVP